MMLMKRCFTLFGGIGLATMLGFALISSDQLKGTETIIEDSALDNHSHLHQFGKKISKVALRTENGDPYTVPVTFTPTQEQFDETLIIDNNEDLKTWSLENGAYKYSYHSSNAADDWAILPGVQMEPGSYKLTATYYTKSDPENFAIKLGNDRTIEAMTTTLIEKQNYKNSDPVTSSAPFEITESGVYYVSLYAFSEKFKYYFYIKDITIEKMDVTIPKPVVINSVESDVNDVTINFTAPSETVGGDAITSDMNISFSVDGGEFGDEMIASPGATLSKEMTLDFGVHEVSVKATMGEKVSEAVSTSFRVSKKFEDPFPIPAYIAPDEDEFNWCSVFNLNDDSSTWAYADTGNPDNTPSFRYTYSASKDADDWIITPALGCEKGKIYEVTFNISTKYDVEGIEVAAGYEKNPEAMTIEIYKNTNLKTSGAWQEVKAKFTSNQEGKIYLGFHAISAKYKSYIYVQKISVVETSGEQPLKPEFSTSFDGGDGTITVTAPTENIGGGQLSGEVMLALSVDGGDAVTANVQPGASHDFPFTELTRGSHTISATATVVVNEEEFVSEPVEGKLQIGFPSSFAYEVPVTFALNGSDFTDYLIVDNNNDGSTWSPATSVTDGLQYKYNSTNPADDWIITEGVNLEAGITYNIDIDTRCYGPNYSESLDVFIGTTRTAEGMDQVILDLQDINFSEFFTMSNAFTVETTGKYFIGIHAKSAANKFNLYVKNMKITAPILSTPAPAEDLVIDPDQDGLAQATATFRLPTKDRSGADLNAEETLNATVTGSNEVTVTGLPGELLTATVETAIGKSTVSVVVSNSVGESVPVTGDVYCGLAKPSAPKLVKYTVSENNMSATIEWEPVTTASTPGIFAPEKLRYRVFEWDEEDLDWYLVDDVDGTTCVVNVEEGTPLTSMTYGIDAYTSTDGGSPMTQVQIILGTPYSMPMTETFEGGKINYEPLMFSSTLSSSQAPTWSFNYASSAIAAAGNVPALICKTDYNQGDSRLILPKVSTVDGQYATLYLKVYITPSMPTYTALVANANSTVYTILGEVEAGELTGWQTFKFPLPDDMINCGWVQPAVYLDFVHGSSDLAVIGGYSVAVDETSAVTEIEEVVNEEAEYYNLQGIKVTNPKNGVYIKKLGKTTSKVIVK